MQNLRYTLRFLGRQPLFTAIVIVTFALGIGANTAVFTVLNAVLLRPLPFHEPQNLVALGEYDLRDKTSGAGGIEIHSISYPDFVDCRAQNSVFERVAVYTNQSVKTLTDGRDATHVQGEAVSADLFPLLGVQPILGRTFLSNEDKPGNRVVILSHALWQRQFGGDPIGTFAPEMWTTMSILRESTDGSPPMTEQRGNDFLQCIARLKPNVSIKQAQANIDTIAAALRQQYPDSNANTGAKVLPEVNAMIGSAHSALLMLCAMAACVLLVACVNVANLLLARSLSRNREISIRAALGAGRWHIIKQLLVESILLGAFGGVAGLFVAIWGLGSTRARVYGFPQSWSWNPCRLASGMASVPSRSRNVAE